ncbi:MAG TPA: histidine kinase [Bacteroidales bacterium]|jgi:sensor histidine kinase YesM|nr:histidine kinase [Bacteroidales bacterium]HBZ20199.1 histidine kinase [Bacteroidales bacterium]
MKDKTGEVIKFDFFDKYSPYRLLVVSLVVAVFIIYPNISIFSLERNYLGETRQTAHLLFFIFRYLYFTGFIWILIRYNLRKIKTPAISKRLLQAFLITGIAYLIYVCFSLLLSPKKEWYSGLLVFQFFVMFIFSSLIGHVANLYSEQRRKEQEIEQLRIENLESRYNALTNQINPHFFFNSLNGLTSVIRKKPGDFALEYVNKLSDVFRYILQSDRKGLVTLGEELEFVKAFLYMMEVRFANKLGFKINVPDEKRDLKIPVLSLLPLIENVAMHNTIDSEHHMEVNICLNENLELSVSNPLFPKLAPHESNGTGLKNLENRFMLLMNSQIRIKNDGERFTVYLPLKKA